MADEPCHICGDCWWQDCPNDADEVMYGADLKLRKGQGFLVYSGDVELCVGHMRYAEATHRMNLNWKAIEQAIARQKDRV